MEIYLVSISGVLTLLFRDVRKLSTPLARSLLSGRFIIYFTNVTHIGSVKACKCVSAMVFRNVRFSVLAHD